MSAVTVGAAWRAIRDRFRAARLSTPELDARLLAGHAFGRDTMGMLMGEGEPVGAPELARLEALARRRLAGEPVARILGHKEFFGLDFALNAATLVPRPETERLVELALTTMGKAPRPRILDLGTGSGCIAIAVLANHTGAVAVGVDISAQALTAARGNAITHGVDERLTLIEGSWFLPVAADARFDVIVSNPPYIEGDAIATLMPEVRDFDPAAALDGGADGLDAHRAIVAGATAHLAPGAPLILEIGRGQGAAVADLLTIAGFSDVTTEKDLAGLDRVAFGYHC